MPDYDVDDLGRSNGNWFPEFGGLAHELAMSWPVNAVGRRSVDWAVRDLIIGGAQQDPRNAMLRQLIKNEHPEFYRGTFEMSENDRKQIARGRAFLFFYYLSLLRISHPEDESATTRIEQLKRCCPNLMLVDSSSAPNHRLRPCRHAHQCPFCLGRKVAHLHKDLSASDFIRPDTLLALASIEVNRKQLFSGSRNQVPPIKAKLTKYLRKIAHALDAPGGLTTFQVGPSKELVRTFHEMELGGQASYGFTIRVSLLVELPTDQALERLSAESDTLQFDDIPAFDGNMQPTWTVRAHRHRDALRDLLYGTSPRYGEVGVTGAFAYQQWHLASESQWQEHFAAIRGTNLYSMFGDWRNSRPRQQDSRGLSNASTRRPKYRQRLSLRNANAQRAATATQDAENLVETVIPIANSLAISLGRMPGRKALANACASAGLDIPERMLRRIIKLIATQQTVQLHNVL
ncbi:MAG: hypothetical protein H6822_24090 [Planctomycetaceae bacterium]|nr:hypothetical protein [Planctomycetales bacterium]MCB9925280.1 hypothetical protein [Planctomycetaceae bacterium]